MVADEDDDRAFFARNVVQCVSLAVGGRKPKLRRLRIENDLCSCCRHVAPPCAPNIYSRPANHIGSPPKGDLSETCWICRDGPTRDSCTAVKGTEQCGGLLDHLVGTRNMDCGMLIPKPDGQD